MRFALRASLIIFAFAGTSPTLDRFEFTQVHMGMPVRVVLYASDRASAEGSAKAAFSRIAALDARMSDYRPDSEVSGLSELPSGSWTPVSTELCRVLDRALFVARASDGAFDPTVGPLVDLWWAARQTRTVPTAGAIAISKSRVGWQHVTLDCGASRVRLAVYRMRFDLGGIAKGFILQEALGVLRARGAGRALLEAGGDIVVGDAPPDRDGWQIDVAHGDDAFRTTAQGLTNAALATSGPDAQFYEIGGVRYSHVIDPRSGRPLTSNRIVSVIAPDGATADALATALGVLGDADAVRFLAQFPGVLWTSASR